jgi:tetratricopeptide (TPR) repeat protein
MPSVRAILAAILTCSLLASWPGWAQTDPYAADRERALTYHRHGDVAGALAAVEQILARSPNDTDALYQSGVANFELGNLDAARGRVERLVKDTGNYAAGWELMTQIAQAQGDLKRRDEAVERLMISIQSAIDPDIRRQDMFIRDRIPAGKETVVAADYFDRHGDDFTRYQFSTSDPHETVGFGLLLRTDPATTEQWSETALLPPDKLLFHLDMVDPGKGDDPDVSVYQYYVGEPDYDTVRAKVMQILRGEVQPLSGKPGSLAGILKP